MVSTFRVGLLLTEWCNAECAHCWFSSGPDRTRCMEAHEARHYIDQADEIPSVEWISFTGGEPFFNPEVLLELVEYASDLGFYTECVTNCFWAEDREKASAILDGLVNAGLNAINISSDDFHQRFIPFERVRTCYETARDQGLKIVIMSTPEKKGTLDVEEIARRLGRDEVQTVRDGPPKASTVALAVESSFVPVGRGASIPVKEWNFGDGPLRGECRDVLRDIGITPSGDVLPCCSAAGIVENTVLGNAKGTNLQTMIEAAEAQPLFRILSSEGPMRLAELLEMNVEGRFVNRCHLCHAVLTHPELPRILSEL